MIKDDDGLAWKEGSGEVQGRFYKNKAFFPFDLKSLYIHFVDFMSPNIYIIYPDVTTDDAI